MVLKWDSRLAKYGTCKHNGSQTFCCPFSLKQARKKFSDFPLKYIIQDKPRGTQGKQTMVFSKVQKHTHTKIPNK